jgi:SpoVK/Ycf46/Vps4 family AAA+-type ATPase
MVDLSRSIRNLLDGALDRAARCQQQDHYGEAADAWDDAARLALKYAEFAAHPSERQRRLEAAVQFRDRAQQLRDAVRQEAASAGSGDPRRTGNGRQTDDEVPPDPDGLRSLVRSLVHKSSVGWSDIAGLEDTKRAIQTAYALSVARPPVGVELKPARSVLFYGPPGCGKSLLAAATSHNLDATFFNVPVSGLVSKWFGESSKLVAALFGEARRAAPSVVFLDEIDALARRRDDSEAGASRQILGSLLSELDGVATKGASPFVLAIAATNAPWDLDPALLSRFGRKVLIPLPDRSTRQQILELQLARRGYEIDVPLERLSDQTEGFSGRELERLAERLVERMIRDVNPDLTAIAAQGRQALAEYQVAVRPITQADLDAVMANLRADTPRTLLERYAAWNHAD